MATYEEMFRRSMEDPDGFWGEAAEDITWVKKWDKVLDDSNKPFYRWFTGGELNTCYNAVDRHVLAGRGRPAGHHLRQPGDRRRPKDHLFPIPGPGVPAGGRPALPGSEKGRHRGHLHAHGAPGPGGHAGLRPHWSYPLGGVRRLCTQGVGHPHRRRQAQGHYQRLLRY